MTRLLLAGALAAGALFGFAPAASACTPDACIQRTCDDIKVCPSICFETPEIAWCPYP